jgi:polyribonucleotide nucleotidyltransferase
LLPDEMAAPAAAVQGGDTEMTRSSITLGEAELVFETGKLAKQAKGACVVTLGETQVLAACTTAKPREGIDFFPLTIDVEERM